MTPLTKPVTRRVGNLIVTIDARGVTLRRFRAHRSTVYTWEQVAILAGPDQPLVAAAERAEGRRVLCELLGDQFRPAVRSKSKWRSEDERNSDGTTEADHAAETSDVES